MNDSTSLDRNELLFEYLDKDGLTGLTVYGAKDRLEVCAETDHWDGKESVYVTLNRSEAKELSERIQQWLRP